jgi:PAS domain S-box-containing protein
MSKKKRLNPLSNAEQRLSLHLEQTPLAVIDWDTDFRVLSWNPAAENIFGYSSSEIIGKNAAELINPENLKKELDEIGQNLIRKAGNIRSSNENITKDGRIIYCEWINTTLVDKKGHIVGISSIVMDLTEIRRNEQLLNSKAALLNAFTQALPDISFIYDEDGRYVEVLASEDSLLYLRAELLVGKLVYDIFPEEFAKNFHTVIRDTIKTLKPQVYEYKLELEAGETWFQARTSPMSTQIQGKNVVVWLAHDITDRKTAEGKIQKLLLEKEILLKEVHHRIKNNMYTISALLSMQSHRMKNQDLDFAFKDAISRIESMSTLYEKLYKSESYGSLSIKDYLSQLVTEIFEIFPKEKDIALELHIDDIEIETSVLFPIGIIINECITNIMKYAFTNKESGKIQIFIIKNGNNISLVVQDDGSGLPSGFDRKKLESFGLSLIDMLVDQLEGSFEMENDNGTKCTIKFCI